MRYRVVVSIWTGLIVAITAPVRAGRIIVLQMFCQNRRHNLPEEEWVVSDNGYPQWNCLWKWSVSEAKLASFRRTCSRFKIVKAKLKCFTALNVHLSLGIENLSYVLRVLVVSVSNWLFLENCFMAFRHLLDGNALLWQWEFGRVAIFY